MSLLQTWAWLDFPSHNFPPYRGAGESHLRVRDSVPCLHVLLHVFHVLHCPQFPSTTTRTTKTYNFMRIYLQILIECMTGRRFSTSRFNFSLSKCSHATTLHSYKIQDGELSSTKSCTRTPKTRLHLRIYIEKYRYNVWFGLVLFSS